jgi:YD repeat-containing protein
LQSRTDALNRTTTYDINSAYVVLSVTRPEGDQDVYSYLRGNLQSITRHPKPGSPLSDIVMSASYDATCSNILTCNNPNSVTDGRQNTTSYTYSANHGGVISELSPAPRAGKARPLKIYSYAQKYAYISDGAGGYVTAGTRIWVPVSETRCQTVVGGTTPTCDTAASKSVTTFEYGAENSANNLLLTATVVSADGVALRTCFRYDKYGNLTSTTSPRAELTTCQ